MLVELARQPTAWPLGSLTNAVAGTPAGKFH